MTELEAQIEKAIKSLLDYQQSRKNPKDAQGRKDLFQENEDLENSSVWLLIALDKIPEKRSVKPVKIEVPNPWRKINGQLSLCVIAKDPHTEYKKSIQELELGCGVKVIGISKLRKKYKAYEAKRQLCAAHDVFVADTRVLTLLPPLLGRTFFLKKKLPIPIDIAKRMKKPETLKAGLISCIECTVYNETTGPCTSIRVGQTSQSAKELKANIVSVIKQLDTTIAGGLSNIRSVQIKTSNSTALPVFVKKIPQPDE